eukprot:s3765_g7.t2
MGLQDSRAARKRWMEMQMRPGKWQNPRRTSRQRPKPMGKPEDLAGIRHRSRYLHDFLPAPGLLLRGPVRFKYAGCTKIASLCRRHGRGLLLLEQDFHHLDASTPSRSLCKAQLHLLHYCRLRECKAVRELTATAQGVLVRQLFSMPADEPSIGRSLRLVSILYKRYSPTARNLTCTEELRDLMGKVPSSPAKQAAEKSWELPVLECDEGCVSAIESCLEEGCSVDALMKLDAAIAKDEKTIEAKLKGKQDAWLQNFLQRSGALRAQLSTMLSRKKSEPWMKQLVKAAQLAFKSSRDGDYPKVGASSYTS